VELGVPGLLVRGSHEVAAETLVGAHVVLDSGVVAVGGPSRGNDDLVRASHHLNHVDRLTRGEDALLLDQGSREVGLKGE